MGVNAVKGQKISFDNQCIFLSQSQMPYGTFRGSNDGIMMFFAVTSDSFCYILQQFSEDPLKSCIQ